MHMRCLVRLQFNVTIVIDDQAPLALSAHPAMPAAPHRQYLTAASRSPTNCQPRRTVSFCYFALLHHAVKVCPGLPPTTPPNAVSEWNVSCTNPTAGSNCTLGCAANSSGIGYTALCINGNWTVTGACARKQQQLLIQPG